MAKKNTDKGGKPLIYYPTVDHGDMDRPTPTYEGDDKGKDKAKTSGDA